MYFSLYEISSYTVFLVNFINKRWGLGSLANKEAGNPKENTPVRRLSFWGFLPNVFGS